MDSGKPSLLRRLASALARLGLDPRPLFQRARNLLLRPVRHELKDARAELAALQGSMAALQAALAELQARVAAGEHRSQAMQAELRGRQQREALLERLVAAGPAVSPAPEAPEPGRPRVSIILPTHDRAGLVAEAIDSVLAQGFRDWELLVVDDGSKDDTDAVLERYRGEPRVRPLRIDHAGASAARNRGLAAARGELIAYLDSDNLWYPGFLQGAVAALDAEPGTALVYGVLVTDAHGLGDSCLLFEEFDRARLLQGNYVDLNTVVHRRGLYDSLGGFDESLPRLIDWDLLLRYTAGHAARAVPVLAARYRVRDARRITDTVPLGPSWLAVQGRALRPVPGHAPRVLYVVWHYPQLSETYLEGEIRCMRRWGAEVEVWREVQPVSPYASAVPVHDGDLAELVRRMRPDVIHIHWLGFALSQAHMLAGLGVPVTLRMHGFDVTAQQFAELLRQPWLHAVYAFPPQLQLLESPDARVKPVPSAFDSSYFRPAARKDRRLVVRTGSCLPSKDIGLFFELAARLTDFRFVFAGVTCNEFEHFPQQLRELAASLHSPVELRFDLPREAAAALIAEAGIYLHTINPPEAPFGAPIGMPISIAEAMATGAYLVVRDQPELLAYVGDAGDAYHDLDGAERLVAATRGWSEAQWRAAADRAIDRAYLHHADELVLLPIFEDWLALARSRAAQEPARIAGAA